MRVSWALAVATVAALAAPPVACAQLGASLHCDDLSASVQANDTLSIVPPCSDPSPTPGTTLIYMRSDPGPTTVTGATLIWYPPFGFTGTTSFKFMAAEQVGGGPQLAKLSNIATATVQVTPPPAPPPPPPDRDGDKVPDASDSCPDAPATGPAPGWYGGYAPAGCPTTAPPFTATAALASIDPVARALQRDWKHRAWRTRALRRGWVQVTLPVPRRTAGSGRVSAWLSEGIGPAGADTHLALRGVRSCKPAAHCTVRARFDRAKLRALAHRGANGFNVAISYTVGEDRARLFVARAVRLGLP